MRLPAIVISCFVTVIALGACGSDSSESSPISNAPDAPDATTVTSPPNGSASPSTTATSSESTAPSEPATSAPSADAAADGEQMFPDVIDAIARRDGDTWTIDATVSSPYDSPERYADAWRVVGADGTVYGERILTHDHASEQPFTRSESGIIIPDGVTEVVIEGRDLEFGYGGQTFTLTLPA